MSVIDSYSMHIHAEKGVGMVELLVAILIFTICILNLTTMQLKAGMDSLDNHQRSIALTSAKGLIDRITANNSNAALLEYRNRITQISDCSSFIPKRCEATPGNASAESCSVTELAAFDVWNVFCSVEAGLESKLIEYRAELACIGVCTANPNMILRILWVSKYADTDERLTESTTYGDMEIASNLDFLTLQFRP